MDEIEDAIASTKAELNRRLLDDDPADPEVRAQTLGLHCKLYDLLATKALEASDYKGHEYFSKEAKLYESLKIRAEQVRKNAAIPKLMRMLAEWKTGASEIREHANRAAFDPADEDL